MSQSVLTWQLRVIAILFLAFLGWNWWTHGNFSAIQRGLQPGSWENMKSDFWLDGIQAKRAAEALDETETRMTDWRKYYDWLVFLGFGRGNKVAVRGHDGFMFYYPNVKQVDENKMDSSPYPEMFDQLEAICRKRGYQLYLLPLLPKSVVYESKLPWDLRGDFSKRRERYTRFLEEMAQREVPVITWLDEAPKDVQVFLKADSHWTHQGADLAAKKVVDRLRADYDFPERELTFKDYTKSDLSDMPKRMEFPLGVVKAYYPHSHPSPILIRPKDIQPDLMLFGTSFSNIFQLSGRVSYHGKLYSDDHARAALHIGMMVQAILTEVDQNPPSFQGMPIVMEFPTRLMDRELDEYMLDQLKYSDEAYGKPVVAEYDLAGVDTVFLNKLKGNTWQPRKSGGYWAITVEDMPEIATADWIEFDLKTKLISRRGSVAVRIAYVHEDLGPFVMYQGMANESREWQTWRFPLFVQGRRSVELRIYPATTDWKTEVSKIRFR